VTIEHTGQIVHLSLKDWIAIAVGIGTLVVMIGGAYLRQDRMLSELMVLSRMQQDRLEKLERRIDEIQVRRDT
jgi:CHASE1-domain containing sensor protein